MMSLFLYNLNQWVMKHVIHSGKTIPQMWYTKHIPGRYQYDAKILSDWRTLVLARGDRDYFYGRNSHKQIWFWQIREFGIKVREDGRIKLWSKSYSTAKKGQHYSTPNLAQIINSNVWDPNNPVVIKFLDHHGVESLEDLVAPGAAMLNIDPKATNLPPWMLNVLNTTNPNEFWGKLGKRKLAKDEKRALITAISTDPRYLAAARIATKMEIPNIRDLKPASDRLGNLHYGMRFLNSSDIGKYITFLRQVPGNRRLMFINEMFAGFTVSDTVEQVRQLRENGCEDPMPSFATVREYHEWARFMARKFHTKLEEIKPIRDKDGNELHGMEVAEGSGIFVVSPKDTHEVVEWGIQQDHCIGSYASQAASGLTILLGFTRKGEWVGHCSISADRYGLHAGEHRITQLLKKHNRRLDYNDELAIRVFLAEHGLNSEGDKFYHPDHPEAAQRNRYRW